jgi:tetratricopeptide (TPR) repeat protein
MKRIILICAILLQASVLFAQQEKKDILKGNELYQQKKYNEAEANYRKALQRQKKNVVGSFNLGDALYKEKKFDQAGKQFTQIAASSKDRAVRAEAYHNLGNTLMQSKKLEESIEAYKKSLINNPKDDQTRYNLAYAQELLKKQQNKNNNNNNNKNNQNKNNQNKNNQNKNDQNKNKDNKNNQDKQNPNKQDDKNRNPQDKQPQPQDPNNLSKEQAQRMLDALNNDEKETQDKLKNQKLKGAKVRVSKDW